jgi:hypothetical protein
VTSVAKILKVAQKSGKRLLQEAEERFTSEEILFFLALFDS